MKVAIPLREIYSGKHVVNQQNRLILQITLTSVETSRLLLKVSQNYCNVASDSTNTQPMTKIVKFYERNINNFWLNPILPACLAAIAFLSKQDYLKILVPTNVTIPVFLPPAMGALATVLLAFHAYFSAAASKIKLKEITFWKKELEGHKWLLNVIKEMIIRKIKIFKKSGATNRDDEYREAIIKNLDMLRAFYSHYFHDPENTFRVVLFHVSDDGKYLTTKFYSTIDGEPPSSHNNLQRQKELFDRTRSQSLAVASWKDLSPKIAKDEKEISYLYPQQREKIKSIIAYPIFTGDKSEENFLGVITVSSKKAYFQNEELEKHCDYISEFALRVVFEHCKWRALCAK